MSLKKKIKTLQNKISNTETKISKLELEIEKMDKELASNYDEVMERADFFVNYERKKDKLQETMEQWELYQEEIEALS